MHCAPWSTPPSLLARLLSCLPVATAGLAMPLTAVSLLAASPERDSRPLTGRPWEDMDYGPFLTASIEAASPRTNIAYKGLAIPVGRAVGSARGEAVLFDTDLLRYAAGWTGDFVALKGVVYDGEHWAWPRIAGVQSFGNPVQPGWCRAGSFTDPREHPYGPLPRDWAKWRGLYVHGEQVVLSYSVGGTPVLELPGLETHPEAKAFARTFRRGAASDSQEVQIAFEAGQTGSVVRREGLEPAASGSAIADLIALLEPAETLAKAKGPETPGDEGLLGRWDFERFDGTTVASEPPGKARLRLFGSPGLAEGRRGYALGFDGTSSQAPVESIPSLDLTRSDFTIAAWVRTTTDGVVWSLAARRGNWVPDAAALFIRDGKLTYDVGWVGAMAGSTELTDGAWHHVAMSWARESGQVTLFVDGRPEATAALRPGKALADPVMRLGFSAPNFPQSPRLQGELDEVRLYDRALAASEVAGLAGGTVAPTVLAAAVVGAPSGAQWVTGAPGHLRLRLPAGAEPTRFKVLLWRGPKAELPAFARLVASSPAPEDLEPLTRGGPPRWAEPLVTAGRAGVGEGAHVIDTLTAPEENPWHSWLRFGGLDFFADGRRMAVCTWNGDVWTVDGVDGDLAELTWRRVATGLFQPLGLKIVNEVIHVLGRDQITRLHDLNGDGEADWYENFNNDCLVSEHFHEFATDLKTDRDGNFYYIKCARHALPAAHPHHGTLLKLPPDGSRLEVVARGLRAVNGLGVGPDGELTCVDNQGHWMPGNRINWIEPGGWYGNQWAWNPDNRTTYDEPLCWMHNFVDRSGGSHLWVPDDRWGALRGQIITISYGMGQMFLVLHETVDGVRQGGVTRFPLEFETGVMRGVFHPGNGQLYAAGLYGWAGNKTRPGGLYRIRHTGRPLRLANAFQVAADGLVLGFTDPLDAEAATDPGNFDVTAWNYRWTATYGSPDLKLDGREGRDRLAVESATLAADRRRVFLKIPGLQPVMQLHVVFKLRTDDGTPFENFIHGTVHRLGSQSGAATLGGGTLARTAGTEVRLRDPAPGLEQTIETRVPVEAGAPPVPDARRARTAALFLPAVTPPTPFLPAGPFRSRWSGFLQLDLNDTRAFQFEGRGAARLRINGESVLEQPGPALEGAASAGVVLRAGPNRFELEYESPEEGDAAIRLLWSGANLPPEPVPPTAFVHEADQPGAVRGELIRTGRHLFLQRQCAKCHQAGPEVAVPADAELAQMAPALDDLGTRVNAAWLAAYLADPPAARDDVLMPRVLRGTPTEVSQQARDIAAFLAGATPPPEASPAPEAALVAAGRAHYDRLGCGACHVLAGEPRLGDDDTRVGLAHVPVKWKPDALVRFLEQPHREHPWTRMPDFKLSRDEAAALAGLVLAQAPTEVPATGNPGDAVRGRELVVSSGCLNCHALSGQENRFRAPSMEALATGDWRRGCTAEDAAARGAAPDFALKPSEITALRAFASTDWQASLGRETPSEFASRHIAALRCTACHGRDGQPDFWMRLTATQAPTGGGGYDDEEEAAAGSVHLGRPDLTFAGEKLHGEWLLRLLTGRLAYKPRPESQGRMPVFHATGAMLATGLAHQHGLAVGVRPVELRDPALVAAGAALTRVEGGFSCVACHPVKEQQALAGPDTATINFAYVADRLRPEYFWRYIRDPQRFRAGTMMPSFIAEDGTTPIKGVLDGDARRQFEAIWEYLQSLRGSTETRSQESGPASRDQGAAR